MIWLESLWTGPAAPDVGAPGFPGVREACCGLLLSTTATSPPLQCGLAVSCPGSPLGLYLAIGGDLGQRAPH